MLYIAVFLILTLTASSPLESCPIARSIYRDGDGKGFQLVFGPPPPGRPFHATAVINHPQQEKLYQFLVNQSSGYGSVWLSPPDRGSSSHNNLLWITFFDRNLKSATPLFLGKETEAPMYAVIAQLGSNDYYRRKGNVTSSTPPLLRDVIWIHDRCQ